MSASFQLDMVWVGDDLECTADHIHSLGSKVADGMADTADTADTVEHKVLELGILLDMASDKDG